MNHPSSAHERPAAGTTLPEMTLREMTLREMTWRDIPALSALEPILFPDDPWSERTWWAELAGRPRRSYVVAEQDGTVVGYAGLDCGGEVADVMTIAVAPAAQGQGLGATFMQWLITEARSAGSEDLMLEVRADNVVAQRLYSASGFALLNVRRKYYQPGDVDALIMRLHLAGETDDQTGGTAEELAMNAAEDAPEDPAEDPQDPAETMTEDLST